MKHDNGVWNIEMTNNQLIAVAMFMIALMMSSGYLYNNAKQQASDIKACQSVDARWRYNSFNQVLCVPKRSYDVE